MNIKKIFAAMQAHMPDVIAHKSTKAKDIWKNFVQLFPADIAFFLTSIDQADAQKLYLMLTQNKKLEVFRAFDDHTQPIFFSFLNDADRMYILDNVSIDEVTDFFDHLSVAERKRYGVFLDKKERAELAARLRFQPDTVGDVMDTSVLSLRKDMTIADSIEILQDLEPDKMLHRHIYVTDKSKKLVGHIHLEDLVLHKPSRKIGDILQENIFVVTTDQDQDDVARLMSHYHETTAPVVDKKSRFLGVVPSDTLVEILEEEASEDIYRMATMHPIKNTYFETPFLRLLWQRSSILIVLLLAQSLSSIIIDYYQGLLTGFLMIFITMLVSTGGNASSQTSAVVIQGLASGEINAMNVLRFLRREMFMACMIAGLLGVFAFLRVYAFYGNALGSFAVSSSLAAIVLISVAFGSFIPLILKKLKMDPAHSAGPLLATLMDIIGLLTYCYISSMIFKAM